MIAEPTFLPSLATSARSLAKSRGRRKRQSIATRLVLVTTAALFGALTLPGTFGDQHLDYAGVAALAAFLVVLGIRLFGDRELEAVESRANAVADLVTSHAWRYAVGALPYAVTVDRSGGDPRMQLLTNLRNYHKILPDSWATDAGNQITAPMSDLRAAPLSERKEAYLSHRVAPLRADSGSTGGKLDTRGRFLVILILCVELIGVPAGALKAFGLLPLDLLGVTAAAAASMALWADTMSYRSRARSAAATGATLTFASDLLTTGAQTEHDWAVMVARFEALLTLDSEALLAPDTVRHPLDADSEDARVMSPDEYFAAARELRRQIWDGSGRLPKLEPDVIVALNPGGAILGGILYFMTRAGDFLPLSLRSGVEEEATEAFLRAAPWLARKSDRLSVLIVDASVKSGDSLEKGVRIVKRVVESKGWMPDTDSSPSTGGPSRRTYVLRTAVIAKKPVTPPERDTRTKVDYYVDEVTERFPYGNI